MSQMTTNYLNPVTGWFEQVHGHNGRMHVSGETDVDPADNRSYFFFHEYTLAASAVEIVKVVITGDTVMRRFDIKLMAGQARIEIVSGGTEGGTFGTTVPILPINGMSTAETRATGTTVTAGGTLTGGTTLDLFLMDFTNQSAGGSVGEAFSIGFSAGTYYIRVTNTDNSEITGLIKALWREIN